MDGDARLIVDDARLGAAVDALAGCDRLAVDTEFLWERTYAPRLALLQVAGRTAAGEVVAWAVDPLAVDPGPLVALLHEPGRLKVLHAGTTDLQILHDWRGAPVPQVFDTQRAAALAGFGQQVGYANLVEGLLGRKLDKAEQWSDWTRRPLRPEQVEYALLDVVPLLDVHERLLGLLEEAGRRAWAEDEMRPLTDPARYVAPPEEEAWRRVRGRRGLDRRGLAALRALAAWRERTARARDLRPGFVVKDAGLLELARRRPRTQAELERLRGLHPNEVGRHGATILAELERVAALPEDALPAAERKRAGPEVSATVDLLRAWVGQRAREAGVAPEVVVNGAALERLVRAHAAGEDLTPGGGGAGPGGAGPGDDEGEGEGEPGAERDVLQGWRLELVGRDLLAILRGERALAHDPAAGRLTLR